MASNYSILVDVLLNTKNIQKQLDKVKVNFNVDTKSLQNVTNSIKSLKNVSSSINDIGKNAKNASKTMQTLSASTDSAAQSSESLILTYQVANEIFNKSIETVSAFVEQVYEMDGAITEFKKVSDLSGASLDAYVDKLSNMGREVARTGSEMVEAATNFKKSGYSEEDSATLALVASQFQNVADEAITAGEASNFIIAQMKAFNIEAGNAEHIIDAINEVSNNFAVSSADLSENLGKASAALATGNTTYEETLGLN